MFNFIYQLPILPFSDALISFSLKPRCMRLCIRLAHKSAHLIQKINIRSPLIAAPDNGFMHLHKNMHMKRAGVAGSRARALG